MTSKRVAGESAEPHKPEEKPKAKKAWVKGKGVQKEGGSKPKKKRREKDSGAAGAAAAGAEAGEGPGAGDSLEIDEANALRAKLGLKPLR